MMKTESALSFLSTFKRFMGDETPTASRKRSWAGILIAVGLIPLLLGVMACLTLPVPVGNPEKSRVDPALSGIWLTSSDGDFLLMVLDPYDKRTWLVSWTELTAKTSPESGQIDDPDSSPDNTLDNNEEDNWESALALLNENRFDADDLALYKGWLTRIKDERFLTLEPKTFQPHVRPEEWWVFRVRQDGENQLNLDVVSPGFEGLSEVETRAAAEKIIRRNLKNPDLFGGDETVSLNYHKLSEDYFDAVDQLLEDSGISDGM